MRTTTTALLLAAAATTTVLAARPSNESICDYYTTALFTNNTAANQLALVTAVVNTAVIGNYTLVPTSPNITVPGILASNAMYNGTAVNLVPYFNGGLASTNTGGSKGMSVNFLDDGGAAPLTMGKPSNGTSSLQYGLLTHLYQYFSLLLGCTSAPTYKGHTSMYQVHKFMALDAAEVGYFIQQVGLAAASFGVADADVMAVGKALTELFDYRCAPAVEVVPGAGKELQAICIDNTCPLSPNATCGAYSPVVTPLLANATMGTNGTMSSNGTATMAGNGSVATGMPTMTGPGGAAATSSSAGGVAMQSSTNAGAVARVQGGLMGMVAVGAAAALF